MAYDLLVKNGRIIDGSGMPAFVGDVAVRHGNIVEMGKLSGAAARTIDATGLVIAPGFIDNHCHGDCLHDGKWHRADGAGTPYRGLARPSPP